MAREADFKVGGGGGGGRLKRTRKRELLAGTGSMPPSPENFEWKSSKIGGKCLTN